MPEPGITIDTEVHWATTLYTAQNPFHGQIKDNLVRYVYDYAAARTEAVASGVADGIKTNLVESEFDFLRGALPEVQSLRNFCGRVVLEAAKHQNQAYWPNAEHFSLDYRESWFHITRSGGYHDFHNHPNCSWCGIYYLESGDAGPGNGCNCFMDPRPGAHGFTDLGTRYLEQNARIEIPPKEGLLVVFPSFLYHSAQPYTGQRDRIVVAFNSSIRPEPTAPIEY